MNKKLFFTIIVLAFFLRIYKIQTFPPGLYSDEASYGYNSYSILKTGGNEYAQKFPLSFKSFGDYKPPLTAYLTIPSIAIFGLNEFAIRLPSALAGTATVAIVYFLTAEIFKVRRKEKGASSPELLPLVASFLITISPWNLLFSRSSMLVGVEVMFTSAGLLFFLKGLKNQKLLIFSAILFCGAIYSYYGARITVTLLVLVLFYIFYKSLKKNPKAVLTALTVGAVFLSPLIFAIVKEPQTLLGRAKTVSIFFDPGIKLKLLEAHNKNGSNYPVLLSRFFHNKTYFYTRDALRRYSQHFSLDFLAVNGDHNAPFVIPNMGLVYLLDTPFFLYGLFLLIRNRSPEKMSLLAYLLISPVAASFSFITPAANRSANILIAWSILSALGLVSFINLLKEKKKFLLKPALYVLVVGYALSFVYYLYQYYVSLPGLFPETWHYGRKELVSKVSKIEANYKNVVVTEAEGPTYIWFLLYKKYDPQKYAKSAKILGPDNLGWLHVESFGKYVFINDFNWEKIDKNPQTLYAIHGNLLPDFWQGKIGGNSYRLILDDSVLYPNGQVDYKIGHLEKI